VTAKRVRRRKIQTAATIAAILGALLLIAVVLLSKGFYQQYFNYHPKSDGPISVSVPKVGKIDHSYDQTKAQAIPVIFYHGILADDKADNINVTEAEFVSQMVDLKRAGYYTIDSEDLYDFYKGKTFYGKPILVTFDDGRLDSWVRGDDVLKKLDFKAVMFDVSGKQDNHNDPFFLTWADLAKMNDSGRWDIESHGWYSHTKIPIDPQGDEANPLTDRKYIASQGRLETFAEAEARITNDYQQNLLDLHNHFPKNNIYAFAVPYGDYGQKANDFSNFPDAEVLNYGICKEYYHLCMDVSEQPFNFPEHDPLHTQRLGIGAGWSGQDLMFALSRDFPKAPQFNLNFAQARPPALPTPYRLLGTMKQQPSGALLASADSSDGYINLDFGDINALNYTIKTTAQLVKGSSLNLSFYKTDANDHLLFGVSDGEAQLQSVIGGKQKVIKEAALLNYYNPLAQHTLQVSVKGFTVSCWIDGKEVIKNATFSGLEPHGQFGFDVWGQYGSQMLLKQFSVTKS
jgi:peptidoglycan/xylan/chitin deacetylase (PgdA/CDA1 family)